MRWTQPNKQQRRTLLRTLATLLESGLTLTDSLTVLGRSQAGEFATLIQPFATALQRGAPLAEAAERAKWPLTQGQRLALDTAERSGRLGEVLQLLADSDERLGQIVQKAWGAARYPMIIGGLSLLIMIGLLLGIVPQFEALYGRFQAELPAATQSLLTLSRALNQWGGQLIALALVTCVASGLVYSRSTSLRFIWHRTMNRLPVIGTVRLQLAGLAFSEGMQLYLAAGLALPEALRYTAVLIENPPIQAQLDALARGIDQGRSDRRDLDRVLLPDDTIHLWQLGLDAGGLPRYLKMNSRHLESQLDQRLTHLTSLLEPLLMAMLGLLVGGFMLALYQPMFTMGALS
ncbi:MAG: type II secretion system F family protein [Litorivicinaceae bacterium]